ncbi:hypothetical protein LTR28_009623 [Elasticomyces elasticus]|nr:hypothetical protein LTR28_009623 [Elasticomyces elasticus]
MEAPNEPEEGRNEFHAQSPAKPRQLPEDLPRSLDDRRPYTEETELYDAWQGQSQFLTAPSLARPTSFNLSLAYQDEQDEHTALEDSDRRLVQMMAAQARLKDDDTGANDEEDVLTDRKLSPDQKSEMLQSFLFMAASNGDAKRVQRLVRGQASSYVKVDAVDAEGTPPLVYASCFGHKDVVLALLDSGAEVDKQDRNQWSPLMWAMTNRHKDIAKILLDHGASPDIKSSTGRTAFDFVAPNSEMSEYLHDNGYAIGHDGIANDFYDSGFSQDRFEEEMAESEMKRRMMMESAVNLEVDLGNLGLDEQPEVIVPPHKPNWHVTDI